VEPWQEAWRRIAPKLPRAGLRRLLKALREDDPRLIQGEVAEVRDGCQHGCAISWGAMPDREMTPEEWAKEADDQFHRLESGILADWVALGCVGPTVDTFTRFFDSGDRQAVFAALAAEIELGLAGEEE